MLHESLKRRWHEPGLTYEPPQKIQRLSTSSLDLRDRKFILKNQLSCTNSHHSPDRRANNRTAGKRKLASCVDFEAVNTEHSGISSPRCEQEISEYHPAKRLKSSLPGNRSIGSYKQKVRHRNGIEVNLVA